MKMTNYDSIASEYYDDRHITSRNFDTATLAFLRTWHNPIPTDGIVLDLGCGRGCANYYCGIASDRIVQCDISKRMLNLEPRETCREQIQSDATALDLPNNNFVAVVSFLFDAFNKTATYREISRVLMSGGVFLGTLPHYTWGKLLRSIRGYNENKAKFLMKDGTFFEVDSFLMDDDQITRSLREANLEQLDSFDLHIPKSERTISPDILAPAKAAKISPYDLPIVKLIVAKKK